MNAAYDTPLTAEQIENWRRVFPELRHATDIEVQLYRDRFQQAANDAETEDNATARDAETTTIQ